MGRGWGEGKIKIIVSKHCTYFRILTACFHRNWNAKEHTAAAFTNVEMLCGLVACKGLVKGTMTTHSPRHLLPLLHNRILAMMFCKI